jgi:hypothetical protein
MKLGLRRRRTAAAVLGLVLLLLALAVLLWRGWAGEPRERVALAKRVLVAEVGPLPSADVPPAIRPARQVGAGEAELCGVGILDTRALKDFFFNESGYVRTVRAMLAALAANPEPRAQATGLYLQVHENFWNRDLRQQQEEVAACDGVAADASAAVPPACRQARERAQQRWQAGQTRALAPTLQLAQLARRSADPQVLALAYYTCRSNGDAAAIDACQQGLLQQWARVEPDNAVPWLGLMGEARAAKSDGALADALYHLAQAHYERSYAGMMVPWIARNRPPEQRDGDDARLLELAASTAFATPLPGYGALTQACLGPNLQDANRRQLCAAATELLASQPDSLITLSISRRLGQGLGWPQERLARLDSEYQALRQAIVEADANEQMSGPGCAAQDRMYSYLRSVGQHGEVDGMRRLVAASGKSMAQLAQDYAASAEGKQLAALRAAGGASRPASGAP